MSNIICDKYVIILSTYQLEWIKNFGEDGIKELKRWADIYDLYIQDWGKPRHKMIVNEKGELELI